MTDTAATEPNREQPQSAAVRGRRKKKKKYTPRDEELSGRPEIDEKLGKVWDAVDKGFTDQAERADSNLDYWEAYNCELGRFQNYTGNLSQIFVPIIKNAVDALVTRYVNQAFPNSGRHVEAITGETDEPFALLSLIEHYIEKGQLRTGAARAILTNGQVEGQYNAYRRWTSIKRRVVSRETAPLKGEDGMEHPDLGQVETIVEETMEEECPMLEALHDNDVLVLPQTACSIDEALENGGSVTVVRRWSKTQIEKMRDDGDFVADEADDLLEKMGADSKIKDTAKALASAAGIYVSNKSTITVGWETWTKLKVDGESRLCRAYFGPEKQVLGCKQNPHWDDRCPVLSEAVKKLPGVFKGESPVAACMGLQVQANDAANEAGHMLYFALAPVLAVNPQTVEKWKDLVSDVAAVWPVDPNGIKMFQWPNMMREALEVISFNKQVILETLGVSPGLLPQQTGKPGTKRNQAEVALEQQVEILQTASAVTVFEQGILTPYVQWSADADHQFREKDVLVRQFGELGMAMGMERIPPQQSGNRWRLRWSGVEAARNAANIQQMIGFLATLSKIPPQQYMGYRVQAAALLEYCIGQIFPARLARQTFVSMKDEMSVPPEIENQMLQQGFEVHTHAADNDPEHLKVHAQLPPSPARDTHMKMHQMAMRMKQAAMAAQGQPGVAPKGPGPRAGAKPALVPRRPQQPAGAIHPDQMSRAGAPAMPRKM